MRILNLFLILFFLVFFTVMNSCGDKVFELDRTNYELDDLYTMIVEPPNGSSGIIRHPSPKYVSDTGYSYFYETEGKGVGLGKRFDKDHEYRFDEGLSGGRFFRDRCGVVKIISGYSPISEDEPFELSGIFSEISGEVVVDKLTKRDGYIVFLVKADYPKDLLEKTYYLMVARNRGMRFSASISRSLFTKKELNRMDMSIRSGAEVWGKYFSAEPPGKYLPESGSDQGVRPGSGDVIAPYSPNQGFSE
jgi:hypothetical protein